VLAFVCSMIVDICVRMVTTVMWWRVRSFEWSVVVVVVFARSAVAVVGVAVSGSGGFDKQEEDAVGGDDVVVRAKFTTEPEHDVGGVDVEAGTDEWENFVQGVVAVV
jgi:hypothetical protein